MQNATMDTVLAVLKSDRTIKDTDRMRLATLLRGGISDEPKTDRLLRRVEAARLLGRSVKGVDRLVERGVLHRVTFPGYSRSAGFRMSDIASVIAGVNSEPEDAEALAGGGI